MSELTPEERFQRAQFARRQHRELWDRVEASLAEWRAQIEAKKVRDDE